MGKPLMSKVFGHKLKCCAILKFDLIMIVRGRSEGHQTYYDLF